MKELIGEEKILSENARNKKLIQDRIKELIFEKEKHKERIKRLKQDLDYTKSQIEDEIASLEMKIKECDMLIEAYSNQKFLYSNPSRRTFRRKKSEVQNR